MQATTDNFVNHKTRKYIRHQISKYIFEPECIDSYIYIIQNHNFQPNDYYFIRHDTLAYDMN